MSNMTVGRYSNPSLPCWASHYPGPESVLQFAAKIPGRCTPFCGSQLLESTVQGKFPNKVVSGEKLRSSKLDILTCCCLQRLLHIVGNLLKNRGWNYRYKLICRNIGLIVSHISLGRSESTVNKPWHSKTCDFHSKVARVLLEDHSK